MRKVRSIYQADIPGVGSMIMSEVSDPYAEKTCKGLEDFLYEPEVIKLVRELNYGTFIDIGAAFGYFSLLAHSLGRKVVAVEAHPIRFGYLWWNMLGLKDAIIMPHLVTNGVDSASFTSADMGGLIGKPIGTRIENTYKTPTITLHEIIESLPMSYNSFDSKMLIKIDVEGFEVDVLRGASQVLTGDTGISWIIEVHQPLVSPDEILSYFPNRKTTLVLDRGVGRTNTFLIE